MLFQYARNCKSTCHKCNKVIQAGDLQVSCERNRYHFLCLINTCSFDGRQKNVIEIIYKINNLSESPQRSSSSFVSLEVYDRHPADYELGITVSDVTKIREQIALAREHKTTYFIPRVVSKTSPVQCCCCIRDFPAAEERLELHFRDNTYHPSCLLKTGKVNLDAKEINGYDVLADNEKELLDELFKDDDDDYIRPKAETKSVDDEYCSFLNCSAFRSTNSISALLKGLRIRYKTKVYHPNCFSAMRKVNIDGHEIGNYYSLSDNSKKLLDKYFKKSDVFDIPVIVKALNEDYCNAHKCHHAVGISQFPWPYTITKNQLQIKFHGDIFHAKCFKSTTNINMAAKDFYGYNKLDNEDKQALDEIFVQNDVVVDGAVDGDNSEDLGQSNNAEHGNDDQETQEEPGHIQEDTVTPNNGLQLATVESDDQNENMVTALSEDVEMQELDSDDVVIDGNEKQPSGLQPPTTDDFGNGNEVDGSLDGNNLKRNAEDATVNNDTNDDDDVIQEPPAKKKNDESKAEEKMETNDQLNNEERTENITLFKYKIPNDDFIQSVFEKLQLPDNNQVYHFWAEVSRNTVFTITSTPTSTFDISSADDSFFKSLSCFFTGKEEKYLWIKRTIQAYFLNNFKTFGTIAGIDFSKLDTTSNQFDEFYECKELSNIHFTFICSWLKCRIGIFSPGHDGLQKYGSWEEEGHPILLIQNENGFFKPVLTLI